MKIAVIQGPNLNMLGIREQHIYGGITLEQIHSQLQNAALIREKVCAGLDSMGLVIDPVKNDKRSSVARDISTNGSTARIFVIPTQEEYVIANDTYNIVSGRQN